MDGADHVRHYHFFDEDRPFTSEEIAHLEYCLECGRGYHLPQKFEAGFRLLVQLCAIVPLALGAFILGGGPDRFAGPSFRVPNIVMGYQGWGTLFVAVGLVMAVQAIRFSKRFFWSALACALIYGFFVACFILSIITEPDVPTGTPRAATTGIIAYTGLAAFTLVAGVIASYDMLARVQDRLVRFVKRLFGRGKTDGEGPA